MVQDALPHRIYGSLTQSLPGIRVSYAIWSGRRYNKLSLIVRMNTTSAGLIDSAEQVMCKVNTSQ